MKYFLIALFFAACQNGPSDKKVILSNEKLDTIKSIPALSGTEPALFETAFMKGTIKKTTTASFNFYGITIGHLKLPTGKVVACDPLHIDEYGIPYLQSFPTGQFPVQLAIAALKNEEAIAFARIKFSDEPVVKWELARLAGKPGSALTTEDQGYSVDASVGIFMDEQAIKGLDPQDIWEKESEHEIFKEMDKHSHGDWRYTIYNFGANNLAAFTSGFGDGRYASYIGFDAAGKPCRLVTDFNLFERAR